MIIQNGSWLSDRISTPTLKNRRPPCAYVTSAQQPRHTPDEPQYAHDRRQHHRAKQHNWHDTAQELPRQPECRADNRPPTNRQLAAIRKIRLKLRIIIFKNKNGSPYLHSGMYANLSFSISPYTLSDTISAM